MSGTGSLTARIERVKREASLSEVIGKRVKLNAAGREWQACCPFHEERTPSFTVVPAKGFAHCFGCQWHGDVIRFVQDFDRIGFREALERIEGECGIAGAKSEQVERKAEPVRRESDRAPRGDSYVDSTVAGQAVWRDGQAAAGSLVEVYLRARGVDSHATGILNVLRFHPRCPVKLWRRWENPRDLRDTCEAMLVPICSLVGPPGGRRWAQQGVELVFLAPDGCSKRRFAPWRRRDGTMVQPKSRKIWGEAAGGACPVPPALWSDWIDAEWLGADCSAPLVVGEGLESTLSLIERIGRERAVRGGAATLSLGNLQGGWLTERDAMPLHNLRPDPERQPFVVRDAGAVIIGSDADMKGLRDRKLIERPRGRVVRRDLTGLERTRICEQLAVGHWRQAGADPVQAMRPPMGMDFNDEARIGRAA